jgi:hypothetical protein
MTNRQKKGSVSSKFRCGVCGKVASTLTLAVPGQPDPRLTPEPKGLPPGISMVFKETTRLAIDGGPAAGTVSVPHDQVNRVKAALLAGNAAELYAIDREFAPFWCPKCEQSYCKKHYVSFAEFDDGCFDCYTGICPQGHKRILSD